MRIRRNDFRDRDFVEMKIREMYFVEMRIWEMYFGEMRTQRNDLRENAFR